MKNLLISGLMFFLVFQLKAQHNLLIYQVNGTTEAFPIDEVQSIKFGTNTMTVYETNGTNTTWNIEDLEKYEFESTMNVINASQIDVSSVNIYPNPTAASTNIKFISDAPTPIEMVIFDASGKKVVSLFEGIHEGEKIYIWNVNVNPGVYYCKIKTRHKTISKPIIVE